MQKLIVLRPFLSRNPKIIRNFSQIGSFGEGAGRGGGGGGSIRSAGGSFGKMEAAHEEEYFHKLRREQLKRLREKVVNEHEFHADAIKQHEEAIRRHKEEIGKMLKKKH